MRKPLIAGNWKMFKTVHEAVVFVNELRGALKDVDDVDIVVAPPFIAVHAVAEALADRNIAVAAQNLHWEREGAFTGEVSAPMIKDAGATLVIIGHSERRPLFGETDATVNRKIDAALAAGLTPIVCVGETLEERERNETLDVLDRQIKDGLDGFTGDAGRRPDSWPTSRCGRSARAETPPPAQARRSPPHIRGPLRQWFGADAAERCRILYGGSVKPDNIAELDRESRTWTARWSAARASTCRALRRSCQNARPAAV